MISERHTYPHHIRAAYYGDDFLQVCNRWLIEPSDTTEDKVAFKEHLRSHSQFYVFGRIGGRDILENFDEEDVAIDCFLRNERMWQWLRGEHE